MTTASVSNAGQGHIGLRRRLSNTRKRSISSSIINFFNNNRNNDTNMDEIPESVKEVDSVQSSNRAGSIEVKRRRKQDTISTVNPERDTLILYETGSDFRPPVLPILPIQRLRLLRQKQFLRRMNDRNFVTRHSTSLMSIGDDSEIQGNDTVLYHKSVTPSPIKKPARSSHLKSIASSQNVNTRRKTQGIKWSGSFEYDLSEYDSIPEKKPVTNEQKDAGLTIRLNTNINGLETKAGDSSLSGAQKKLLINGVKPLVKSKIALKEPVKNIATSSKVVLPTAGFDFIKDTGTPSKKAPVSFSLNKGKALQQPQKSLSTDEKKISEAPKISLNLIPSKSQTSTSATKPAFSFVSTSKKQEVEEDDDKEEPRRKKRSAPKGPSINLTSTLSGNKDGGSKEEPRISFGLNGKKEDAKIPSFSFGATEPTERTTFTEPKLSEKTPTTKPAFSFGTSATTGSTTITAPSFSLGAPKSSEETLKATVPVLSLDKEETSTKPTFSFGASLGKKTEEGPAIPSFSFGAPSTKKEDMPTEATIKEAKPTFSFGKQTDEAKPAFSFGEPADVKKEEPKPAFSFGTTSSQGDKADPAKISTFSFSKPNITNVEKEAVISDIKVPVGGFSFGNKENNISTASNGSASSFQFSRPQDKPASGFSFNKLPPPVVAPEKKAETGTTGFSFKKLPTSGSTSAVSTNNPLLGTGTAAAAVPSFNFGSNKSDNQPATPGFSFGKPSNSTGNLQQSLFPTSASSTATSGTYGANTFNASINPLLSSAANGSGANPLLSSQPNNNAGFNFGVNGSNPNTAQSVFQGNTFNPPAVDGFSSNPAPQVNFHPSATANINFGGGGNVNPAAIFNAQTPVTTNTAPQQPGGLMTQRKMARMRQPRR
ncbi:hypothetical protein KAFR_0J01940 [Kazachstania africana CBS 2517]|uniref:Uncharacterized protein n=1 Tax=Kazachstania africana (strain ATCC 22294 / BCRC 22015 / CBS 2517 / CECT 1963 / NBRC 1671 / NRRL Y-8276) TaxID=1071382 RepID=H2B0V8_KAZAF|nr:hypothetical protein KAFR_0J01940 [Kazachstania africana CBS 2517]CCF60258.1 hypothetical protein KAFR_0J01940 [Kazachstania africana CBS 2517]